MDKSPEAFRTISEVADWLGVQAHVLRFWESKFSQVKPVKRAGGRRYYRPTDMQLIGGIKKLLHDDGLTIKGVQKILREQGVGHVVALSQSLDEMAAAHSGATDEPAKVVNIKSNRASSDPRPPAPAPRTAPDEEPVQAAFDIDPPQDDPPAPHAETPTAEPEPAVVGDQAEATPVEEPPAGDDVADLPSFLHRPLDETAAAEPASDNPPAPAPIKLDIADPPPDNAQPYQLGPMARLAKIDGFSPDQAARIAPLADQLAAWRDRVAGSAQA